MRRPRVASQPKVPRDPRARFDTTPDGWPHRLKLALRLGNGCVLTARQCEQLAEALGWQAKDPPTEAA